MILQQIFRELGCELKQIEIWTPTQDSYSGHGQFIVESDLSKAYEAYHPNLPEFIAEAVQAFSALELANL